MPETWVCRKRKCDFTYASPIKLEGCSHEVNDTGKKEVHPMKKEEST